MKAGDIKEKVKNHKTILENFSYMTVLQVFIMLTPLITYPYLTRVLGTELYGLVITAQILASYATIVVRFGFDSVSARHISLWRDDKEKLSEVMSSIMTVRIFLWIICSVVYAVIVFLVPIYRQHYYLFLFSYGLTFETLFFPHFFFQGVERMKYITYINIGIQAIFIALVYIVIRRPEDYLFVPVLYTIGYLCGGIIAFYIIYKSYGLRFYLPSKHQATYYLKDAFPLFATDAVCTIKDKLGYLLLGVLVSMGDVVVYDVGSRLTSLAIRPLTIINTVIFPKMAKEKNDRQFKQFGVIIFASIVVIVLMANIFLHPIVYFLIGKEVSLMPIRLFLLSPIFLGVGSYIGSSLIVARGYNKYMFYSIIVTTSAYLLMMAVMFFSNKLNTVLSFIVLTVMAYLVEMIYRLFVARRIMKENIKKEGLNYEI